MAIDTHAYKHALYPLGTPPHLSDEDIAMQLDKSAKHSRAAHKAQERRRQRLAEKQNAQEKQA
jgi:hypothetical protein